MIGTVKKRCEQSMIHNHIIFNICLILVSISHINKYNFLNNRNVNIYNLPISTHPYRQDPEMHLATKYLEAGNMPP